MKPVHTHTPGPWIFGRDSLCVITPTGQLIADLGESYRVIEDEIQHDGRLIAAAPDLLAALEKIVAVNGSTGGAEAIVAEFKFIASEAIAKASSE
jgi:hypothetical protein